MGGALAHWLLMDIPPHPGTEFIELEVPCDASVFFSTYLDTLELL